MISALLVLGCCFGGTLYAQAPCCKPTPDCKKVCAPSSASTNAGEASVAIVPASMGAQKACSGQTAKSTSARTTGYMVSNNQTEGATAKANCVPANCDLSKCDPTNCDWSKCLPPGCDPSKCDLSKCMPGGKAATGKASRAVRL